MTDPRRSYRILPRESRSGQGVRGGMRKSASDEVRAIHREGSNRFVVRPFQEPADDSRGAASELVAAGLGIDLYQDGPFTLEQSRALSIRTSGRGSASGV